MSLFCVCSGDLLGPLYLMAEVQSDNRVVAWESLDSRVEVTLIFAGLGGCE